MPVFQETRTTVRQRIGGARKLLIDTLTITDATPALVRAADAAFRNADQGRGLNLYTVGGGGAGQSRTVVSMTELVVGTGCLFHVHLNFTPAPSTNSSIELCRGIPATEVHEYIDDPVRAAARLILDHKEDYSIQLGDALRHWGSFERWPEGSGVLNPPDGWNNTSGNDVVQRESVIKFSGRYALHQRNTDANEGVIESDDIPEWPKFAGEVVSVFAKVYSTTGARVRLQLLDGVNTFNGNLHDGSGGFDGASGEPISIDAVTVAQNLTQLRVRLTILTGGQVDAYWGKVWIEHDGRVYDFELQAETAPGTSDETAFAYISEIWAESRTQAGEFNTRIPNEYWTIDAGSTVRRLIFTKGLIDEFGGRGRQIKVIGQSHPRLPQADTDNLEVDPEYVRVSASYRVMEHLPWNELNRSMRDRFNREAKDLLQDITTTPYPDAIQVEAW